MNKALVIDDSEIDRKVAIRCLRSLGIMGLEEENGEAAYSALALHPEVKLLLIDWNMPVLNGIDLVRRIRSEKKFDDLKLVMVTSSNSVEEILSALDAGVDEYIMKPFDRVILRDKLMLVGFKADRERREEVH